MLKEVFGQGISVTTFAGGLNGVPNQLDPATEDPLMEWDLQHSFAVHTVFALIPMGICTSQMPTTIRFAK